MDEREIRTKLWRLEGELSEKRGEYEKLEASSSISPSTPFLERILRKRLGGFMSVEEDRLRRKILELKQSILQLNQQLELALLQEEKE